MNAFMGSEATKLKVVKAFDGYGCVLYHPVDCRLLGHNRSLLHKEPFTRQSQACRPRCLLDRGLNGALLTELRSHHKMMR